jgi:hypothetical protein
MLGFESLRISRSEVLMRRVLNCQNSELISSKLWGSTEGAWY